MEWRKGTCDRTPSTRIAILVASALLATTACGESGSAGTGAAGGTGIPATAFPATAYPVTAGTAYAVNATPYPSTATPAGTAATAAYTATPAAVATPAPTPVFTAAATALPPPTPATPASGAATAAPTAAPSDSGGGVGSWVWTTLSVIFWIGILGFAAAGALQWLMRRNRRRFGLPDSSDEVCFTTTADGWRLAVHHWYPAADVVTPVGALPVILCHGLAGNRFNMDVEGRSLARFLRDRGYDVWVPELRGTGYSARHATDDWCFDEHVEHDLPAIIDLVLQRSGADAADWIGHSMGGLAAMAHLPNDVGQIRSLCAIGSPTRLEGNVARRIASLSAIVPTIPRWLMPHIPLSAFAAALAPLTSFLLRKWQGGFYALDNMDLHTLRRVAVSVPANVSREMLRQTSAWFTDGAFRSIDRRTDYFERLARISIPVLLVGGAADRFAEPASLERTAAAMGGPVRIEVFGVSYGHELDYGHGDLLVGDKAPQDVFPLLLGWLRERGTGADMGKSARPAQRGSDSPFKPPDMEVDDGWPDFDESLPPDAGKQPAPGDGD